MVVVADIVVVVVVGTVVGPPLAVAKVVVLRVGRVEGTLIQVPSLWVAARRARPRMGMEVVFRV